MVRKAGKGKKSKAEKGGERTFVTSLEEMEIRDANEEQKEAARKVRRNEDGDEESGSEEESSSEEEEDDNNGPAFERVQQKSLFGFTQKADGPQFEKTPKKKSGISAVVKDVQNPNLKPTSTKVMKAKDMKEGSGEQQLTRREREAIEKERAQQHYWKKHLAGETDEAKKDLERLKEVRRRREEAEKRKKEEEAAAAEREKNKKKVQVKDDDEPLDARAIKQLKPAILKEKLKERGLSIQGQKKDLIQRLIDYEDDRAL